MEYDKIYRKTEGPTMITTKKDDETGAIVIVSITQTRKENTPHNEEDNKTKRRD